MKLLSTVKSNSNNGDRPRGRWRRFPHKRMHKRAPCHDLLYLFIHRGCVAASIHLHRLKLTREGTQLRLRGRVRMCSDCIWRNISALAMLNVIVCTCLRRRQFNFECRGTSSRSPLKWWRCGWGWEGGGGGVAVVSSGIECVDLKINWGVSTVVARSLRSVALPWWALAAPKRVEDVPGPHCTEEDDDTNRRLFQTVLHPRLINEVESSFRVTVCLGLCSSAALQLDMGVLCLCWAIQRNDTDPGICLLNSRHPGW